MPMAHVRRKVRRDVASDDDARRISTACLHVAAPMPAAAPDEPGKGAVASPWAFALPAAAAGLVALLALFWQTGASMVHQWWSVGTYSHGFLIAPVSAYLIWHRRTLLASLTPRPTLAGLIAMALAVLAWLIGEVSGVLFAQQVALIAMIHGLLLTLLGWPAVRRIAFPLLFLFFAVPFGSFLIPPLQNVTAEFAVRLLRMTGVPVYIDGLLIHIPTGSFIVAEACAGVRFLISTVALGFLGAHLLFRSPWRRLLFVALAFAIPIVANGLRAYGIIMLAYLSDHRLAVGVDHLIYGWIFLSFVTLCLLGVGMLIRDDPASDRPAVLSVPARTVSTPSRQRAAFAGAAAGAVVLAASAPAYAALMEARRADAPLPELGELQVRPPWSPAPTHAATWQPRFPGADAEVLRAFAAGSQTVETHVAYYRHQRQGAEAVSEKNRVADGRGWLRVGAGRREAIIDGQRERVRSVEVRADGEGRLIWYWYWIDERFTSDRITAKILETKAKLLEGDGSAAVVALSTTYAERPEEAARILQDFLDHAGPIGSYLAAAAR